MPDLDYGSSFKTSRDNKDPQSWQHVYDPLVAIRTLLNTTGLDHTNVQDEGLRPENMKVRDTLAAGAIEVAGGATAIPAGSLVSLAWPTTAPSGGGDVVGCQLAQSYLASVATRAWAQAYVPSAIAAGASGLAYRLYYEAAGTSGGTTYQNVYLSTTAGQYTFTAPTGGYVIQVVGRILNTSGLLLFDLPGSIIPYSLVGEV